MSGNTNADTIVQLDDYGSDSPPESPDLSLRRDENIEIPVATNNEDQPSRVKPEAKKEKAPGLYSKFQMTLSAQGEWVRQAKERPGKLKKKMQGAYKKVQSSRAMKIFDNSIRWILRKLPSQYSFSTLYLIILGLLTAFVGVAMDFLGTELDKGILLDIDGNTDSL